MSDLISRAKVLNVVQNADDGNIPYEVIKDIIQGLPSVSAERVGEWLDVENEPYCECSVCGSYIDNLDDDYAFCPRCGSKMKGGAE